MGLLRDLDGKANDVNGSNDDVFIIDVPTRCSATVGQPDYDVDCALPYNMEAGCAEINRVGSNRKMMKKKEKN